MRLQVIKPQLRMSFWQGKRKALALMLVMEFRNAAGGLLQRSGVDAILLSCKSQAEGPKYDGVQLPWIP